MFKYQVMAKLVHDNPNQHCKKLLDIKTHIFLITMGNSVFAATQVLDSIKDISLIVTLSFLLYLLYV